MITTNEVRDKYLKYFESKGHRIVSSDSLIPQNDPTLLFTGAGMNQFKEYFLGIKKDMTRATSSQKCIRTGDLENVGKTPYHHSFFEMLGNFSFGDYFKREAIEWAWEFLTKELSIPAEKLQISVHESDDEAYKIWKDEIKIEESHITKLGDKSNYWPSNAPKDGPNGPCGPCSEIYYDQGKNPKCNEACNIDCECGRFAEIWNLVFTQFDRKDGGVLEPLSNKNIDTGMGLERLVCVLQGKKTNFEIDLFQPMIKKLIKVLGLNNEAVENNRSIVYTIIDHARASIFAINDGAVPVNEGRGYVIRKLIRRATWYGKQLGADGPFINELVDIIIDEMAGVYPELKSNRDSIFLNMKMEEERFWDTLEQGIDILNKMILVAKKDKKKQLTGSNVFKLYDTFGFPDELTELILDAEGLTIDRKGFDLEMRQQKERSKQSSGISGDIFVVSELSKKIADIPDTEFLGYDLCSFEEAEVLFVEQSGTEAVVILNKTPFYGEGGGQVGDRGELENSNFSAVVKDSKKDGERIVHYVEIKKGSVMVGDHVNAIIDRALRASTKRNHTATHILQAVMRDVLGSHVRQMGSLVNEDKLRFDYAHSQALTRSEIEKLETRVNEIILENIPAEAEVKTLEEARKEGALAFFGDKYGDKVRILRVGEVSLEFCGGTHVSRTGDIGAFLITSDSSVSSGTRRIEALTGINALKAIQEQRVKILEVANTLKSSPEDISQRIEKLQIRMRELEKGNRGAKAKSIDLNSLISNAKKWNGFNVIAACFDSIPISELRHTIDVLKQKTKSSILILFSIEEQKSNVIVALSQDMKESNVSSNDILKKVVIPLEGSGGGRKDMAQGGGRNPEKIKELMSNIITILES